MQRWDPCTPQFIVTITRVMVALWLLSLLASMAYARIAFWGVLSGGLVALVAYHLVRRTGELFSPTARYAPLVIGLQVQHLLLWGAMAVLLAVVKVHPVGFLLGASVLPVAVLLSLSWYLYQQKRISS